jgi:hypothetical protein
MINGGEFEKLARKPGVKIVSSIGKSSVTSQVGRAGKVCDVEPDSGYESLRAQAMAVNYAGKCVVRIKFYRRRLADYSRANCEKYIIDSLTYAGLIRDDSEKEIWLVDEGQEKVETDAEERVEVTLEYSEVDLDNLWVKRKLMGNIGKEKK